MKVNAWQRFPSGRLIKCPYSYMTENNYSRITKVILVNSGSPSLDLSTKGLVVLIVKVFSQGRLHSFHSAHTVWAPVEDKCSYDFNLISRKMCFIHKVKVKNHPAHRVRMINNLQHQTWLFKITELSSDDLCPFLFVTECTFNKASVSVTHCGTT